MDFLPDKQFHPLFKRISHKINLKGCYSPKEIDDRIKSRISKVREKKKELREQGYSSKTLGRNIQQLRQLVTSGFSTRSIDEAIAQPRGLEGLTLRYGASKADDILYSRSRSRRRRQRLSFRDRRRLRGIAG